MRGKISAMSTSQNIKSSNSRLQNFNKNRCHQIFCNLLTKDLPFTSQLLLNHSTRIYRIVKYIKALEILLHNIKDAKKKYFRKRYGKRKQNHNKKMVIN